MENTFALKGTVIHTPTMDSFDFYQNAYVVCENGICAGIYDQLPERYKGIPVEDCGDMAIIPGMSDLHIHPSQYGFRGMGQMPVYEEGDNWFKRFTFPEERRCTEMEYAQKAYGKFAEDLLKTTTTRLSAYATISRPTTLLLMDILEKKGFAGCVGKVNMDRNSIPGLLETTEETLAETRQWLEACKGRQNIKPILTPRYTPSCTDECMEGLQALMAEYGVPVQSHLSENLREIDWIHQLKPEAAFYGQAYDMYGMMGTAGPSIMAHCVYSGPREQALFFDQSRSLWVAHCPTGNCISSTMNIAPILQYLRAGAKVGLGTDIAGGYALNMWKTVYDAMMVSKLYWGIHQHKGPPHQPDCLSFAQAFYLATKGGGAFFGKVGSFEQGYEFDAVVIDESRNRDFVDRPLNDRMERMISLSDERETHAKYIKGKKVYQR